MLRQGLIGCLCLLVFSSFVAAAPQEKFAILIPGFFNMPGKRQANYFSNTVVDAVSKAGYTPVVVKSLNPVGTFAENGELLSKELAQIVAAHPNTKFTVIAHSAGGLYLGYALTAQPNLPINTVVTISTPYAGAELVELVKWVPGFRTITNALDLSSLQEFESKNMANILGRIKIPQRIRWIALPAAQPPCHVLNCDDARTQIWLLSLAWSFSDKTGDGVVAVDSALAKSAQVMSLEGPRKSIETWTGYVIQLDHWELNLDSRLFTLLGVDNTDYIDQQQRRVFTEILGKL